MASSSGNSSGSEEASQQMITDIRKRKRMQSNRESARRSRLRKQKHLDDLTAQVNQLQSQNVQISASINVTTEHYLNMDAENSILRAQMAELTNRLQSLNDIIQCLTSCPAATTSNNNISLKTSTESDHQDSFCSFGFDFDDGFSMNPWGFPFAASYPVMPALDAFIC